MTANARQVGGDHYKKPGVTEHWDVVVQHGLDYFQGQITKYIMRWRKKGGIQDLEKARHFLDKYIEVARAATLANPISAQYLGGIEFPEPLPKAGASEEMARPKVRAPRKRAR